MFDLHDRRSGAIALASCCPSVACARLFQRLHIARFGPPRQGNKIRRFPTQQHRLPVSLITVAPPHCRFASFRGVTDAERGLGVTDAERGLIRVADAARRLTAAVSCRRPSDPGVLGLLSRHLRSSVGHRAHGGKRLGGTRHSGSPAARSVPDQTHAPQRGAACRRITAMHPRETRRSERATTPTTRRACRGVLRARVPGLRHMRYPVKPQSAEHSRMGFPGMAANWSRPPRLGPDV